MSKELDIFLNNHTTHDDRYYTETEVNTKLDGKSNTNHTHNYAASASAGGSATSAVKLDSNAGSATQPVYFSGGKPVACTYTLGKSVPANAVFTDTTPAYTTGIGSRDTNWTTTGTGSWYKYGRVVTAIVDVTLSSAFTLLWGEQPVCGGFPESVGNASGYFPAMNDVDNYLGLASFHLMGTSVFVCPRGHSLAGRKLIGVLIYMSKT